MMRKLLVAALVLFFSTGASFAQQPGPDAFTADILNAACTGQAGNDQATRDLAEQTCRFYLRGITDAMFIMQSQAKLGKPTCLPVDTPISVDEARNVFENYLAQHPDAADKDASLVATFSVLYAHSC